MELIRDQGDRQLDLIDKTNFERTGGIKFENEKNKKLVNLAKEIKDEINKIIKEKFVHSAYNKTHNFNKYTYLGDLANRIYDKELSFDEAKKEQEELLEEIEELKKRIKPERGKQPNKRNKESME